MDQKLSWIVHQPPWLPTCVLTFFTEWGENLNRSLKLTTNALSELGTKSGSLVVSWWLVDYQRWSNCLHGFDWSATWLLSSNEEKYWTEAWSWRQTRILNWGQSLFGWLLTQQLFCSLTRIKTHFCCFHGPWSLIFPRPGEAAATRPPSSDSKKGQLQSFVILWWFWWNHFNYPSIRISSQ